MDNEPQNGLWYLLMLILFFALFFGIGSMLGPQDESIFDLETSGDNHSSVNIEKSNSQIKKQIEKEEKSMGMGTLSKALETELDSAGQPVEFDTTTLETPEKKSPDDSVQLRSDVVVRYYKKPLDEQKVLSLTDLGFYVHERPTSKDLMKFASNAIYYGDSVRREDIITIANHLKSQGIELKLIEHSRYGDGWKSHSIEIGVDSTFIDEPTLTEEQIAKIVNENPYIKD